MESKERLKEESASQDWQVAGIINEEAYSLVLGDHKTNSSLYLSTSILRFI